MKKITAIISLCTLTILLTFNASSGFAQTADPTPTTNLDASKFYSSVKYHELNGKQIPLPPSITKHYKLVSIDKTTSNPAPRESAPKLIEAERVVLLDEETGKVLYAKNADVRFAPASMTKLLTLTLLFDEVKSGRIKLNDKVRISENAWRKGGASTGSSTMFAEPGSKVAVKDIIYGIAVQSGNDASIAIAEHIAGTEDQFVHAMNIQAKLLGMNNSRFANASGWPSPNAWTTARDMALLAQIIRKKYKEFFPIFSRKSFTWNGIKQNNRNLLLRDNQSGVDGMKTGHVKSSGYSIVATAKRDQWRIIAVLSGMKSKKSRIIETRTLIDWGYNYLSKISFFEKNKVIGTASIYGGNISELPLTVRNTVSLIVPRWSASAVEVKTKLNTPLIAPIKKGETVGELVFSSWEGEIKKVPIIAGEDANDGGSISRIYSGLANAMGWDKPQLINQIDTLPQTASIDAAK